ncbi:MAG: Ktr system potassium uptake protein A [candidate division WS2 bacterium]|uniref:Ktr system potassium uptake protein A n=1 Tax=Psychracetigena formicireducens TaxID=2986056 RepID=A0A9E2BGL0_PSYF1|nr:Ktr system potassium uptake protein A [Candidatus Psychracetigena formicireducens]MBT9144517.1 Ktr system potassium uptake protein A [Candidatus Psychracetigena formicireducens]
MSRLQCGVIGLGRFGTAVATTLLNLGADVIVLDKTEERAENFRTTPAIAIAGDATNELALREAGIPNCDTVIVAIGKDIQASILITALLKEMGIPLIVVKANDELHGRVLAKIGAHKIIFPERDMGIRTAYSLVTSNILDVLELSKDLSITEIKTPNNIKGKTLKDSKLRERDKINLLAIKRNGKIIVNPEPKEIIQIDDTLIIVGRVGDIQRIQK